MLRSWETTGEKILCHLLRRKNQCLEKSIYPLVDVLLIQLGICMRVRLGVLRLTVAVFLTKNPNLTLSQFWPVAPAEMRNSPLPTNGSFRQEIYVKKTLQHSPGEDVYISLCLQHSKPGKTKNTLSHWTRLLGCFVRRGHSSWLESVWSQLPCCQLMLRSCLLQNNEKWDRVIGLRESVLESELVLIFLGAGQVAERQHQPSPGHFMF